MGYYAKNQYEQPEPPRCLSCDELMVETGRNIWGCRNPACEECPPKYQVVECSTCGEEYTYGEFCQNCVDGAYHDLDISTSTYNELVELRKRQARLVRLGGDDCEHELDTSETGLFCIKCGECF